MEILSVLLKCSKLVSLLDRERREINYFENRSCSDAKWDRERNVCSYVLFRTMMGGEQMVSWLR